MVYATVCNDMGCEIASYHAPDMKALFKMLSVQEWRNGDSIVIGAPDDEESD